MIGTPYRVPEELIEKQNEMFTQMPDEAFLSLGISKEDFISIVNSTMRVDIPGMVDKIQCKKWIEIIMDDSKNYIGWLRSKVGHEKIMLVFAGGCIFNEKEKYCFREEEILINGDFRAALLNLEKRLKWQLYARPKKKQV